MTGYPDDAEHDAEAMRGGYYHTGDVATSDDDGYITYVGRTDDVFKASRLPDLAVRAGERADRARGGGRGGRGAVPRPAPAGRAQGLRAARRAAPTPAAELARDIMAFCRERVAPATSASAGWSSPTCPRRSPARSAASSCAAQETEHPRRPRHHRVLGRGLQLELVTSADVNRAHAIAQNTAA